MSMISSKNINKLSVPQSPVVLAILDGWGYREEISDNAIKSAVHQSWTHCGMLTPTPL